MGEKKRSYLVVLRSSPGQSKTAKGKTQEERKPSEAKGLEDREKFNSTSFTSCKRFEKSVGNRRTWGEKGHADV